MRKGFVFLGFMLSASLGWAQNVNSWTISIEQHGKQLPLNDAITIDKMPFRIVFDGPQDFGYAVVPSPDKNVFSTALSNQSMSNYVRPTNVILEKSDRSDKYLILNLPSELEAHTGQAHLWYEDVDEKMYSFQRYTLAPNNRAVAIRAIDELCSSSGKCGPINATPTSSIYLLVAGVPPGKLDKFVAPRIVRIDLK
jgi:hypothetical protein